MKEQMIFTAPEFIGALKDPSWAPMTAADFNAAKADLMRYMNYGHIAADNVDKPVIGYLAQRFEPVARVAAALEKLGPDAKGHALQSKVVIEGYQVKVSLSRTDKPQPRALSIAYGVDSYDDHVRTVQRSAQGVQTAFGLQAMMAVYGNYDVFGESADLVRSLHMFANSSTAHKNDRIVAAVFEGTDGAAMRVERLRSVVPLVPRVPRKP